MIKNLSFRFNELIIDKAQLEAILGFSEGVPEPFNSYIDETFQFAATLPDIKAAYIIIDKLQIDAIPNTISAEGLTFNIGRKIKKEIRNSERAAFFICTAGETISTKSKTLMKGEDPVLGFVYDTMGSFIAEAAGDKMQKIVLEEISAQGDKITNRYSPGYCQWPVNDQHNLFSLFPKQTCGVCLTESALMNPVKSISGLIGIGKNVNFREYLCDLCSSKDCTYRKIRMNKTNRTFSS